MANIPLDLSRRGLETGSVIQYPKADPMGAAIAGVGEKMEGLAERFATINKQREKTEAAISFDGFKAKVNGETEAEAQKAEPGAKGLTTKLLELTDKRGTEWVAGLPEGQRAEFSLRLKTLREQFSNQFAAKEKTESDRFQTEGLFRRVEEGKKEIQSAGPDRVESWKKSAFELLDGMTIDPIKKSQFKQKIIEDLETEGFNALPTEEKRKVAAGWGLGKGFTGTAVDRTMQVLRDKEGFRSSTYWDVNAHRVGYGSDTITDASGAVRSVKQGDTVSREDAERDLRRRSNQFLSGVQESVGTEAFARLNPNQQAALGSVAYNYGSLPASVVAAVKSGETEAIATSIEGLQGHNNGVNRSRRLSEASLVRSSGDEGPVRGFRAPDERFQNVSPGARQTLAGQVETAWQKERAQEGAAATQAYNTRMNDFLLGIMDGKVNSPDIAQARKDGRLTDAGDISKLTAAIERRDSGIANTQAFNQALADPKFVWNQVSKDHKGMAEAGFASLASLGGAMPALQTVVEKTGIVPSSAAVSLRGAIASSDPVRVQSALQTAANIIAGKNPNIFAGVEGGKDIADAALAFDHYVNGRGMTADAAAKKILEQRTPEYEQTIKAKIKSEDMNDVVKKNLKIGDIEGGFDTVAWIPGTDPRVGFAPESRTRAMGDYEESFREHFAKNGDINLSKALAVKDMKAVYGATNVDGSRFGVVMKYPPERSPAYAGVADIPGMFSRQAIAAIKDVNGADVKRSDLQIWETRGTAERFKRGEPPVYMVGYKDKNGLVQVMPKPFFADPDAMRAQMTAERQAGFTAARSDFATAAKGGPFREAQRTARGAAQQRMQETRMEAGADPNANSVAPNQAASGDDALVTEGREWIQ